MPARKKRKTPPTPPPDPENWQLVKTREGDFYRRKRGTVKEARLNEAFRKNVTLNKLVSPAAKEIRNKLLPFLANLDTGRLIARVSALLRKMYKKYGRPDLQAIGGYDFQPYNPMDELLKTKYTVSIINGEIIIVIEVYKGMIRRTSKIISGYWFEAILLYGDLEKPSSLRTDNDVSPIYNINLNKESACKLSLMLPSRKTSWVVLLKVSCMEGKEPALHSRHYGMKVVLAGSTKT